MKIFKNIIFILALAITYQASAENNKDIDLFIFGGQSNAVGWKSNAEGYPADPEHIDEKIILYCVTPGASEEPGVWKTLGPQPGRFPDGHFGPEITFARGLFKNGMHPAIFKYSIGASSLAGTWKGPGEHGYYDKMTAEFAKALRQLKEKGFKVHIKAFIWIQGESDGKTEKNANAYKKRLQTLISDIRNNVVKNPTLPVILGVDEQHPFLKKHPQIVKAHQEIAENDNNIIFTSMYGLKKADKTHLTPEGVIEHGKRILAAAKKLLNTQDSP